MADFTVSVTANGLVPAVIYAGKEGAEGKTIAFEFSEDWDGLHKEILFFNMRGEPVVNPYISGNEVTIPAEVTMYGGPSKYTVRGFNIDQGYIKDSLQVTGTIYTTYTAGHNPRMEGKLLPSTLDLFLAQAEAAMYRYLEAAKNSGDFDGASAGFGAIEAFAHSLPAGSAPRVTAQMSGPDTAKILTFSFSIPKGEDGEDGTNGQDGRDGMDFRILGHYNSLQALQAAVPNPERGEAYGIGTTTPYNVYVWNGSNWQNFGPIGSNANVDEEMSDSSVNAVQNKVIKEYVDTEIQDALGFIPIYQMPHVPLVLTLDAEDWSENAQTVTAEGVIASSTVFVAPAPSSISEYESCGVYCSAQSDGSLTFTCTEPPENDITVNVAVFAVSGIFGG